MRGRARRYQRDRLRRLSDEKGVPFRDAYKITGGLAQYRARADAGDAAARRLQGGQRGV